MNLVLCVCVCVCRGLSCNTKSDCSMFVFVAISEKSCKHHLSPTRINTFPTMNHLSLSLSLSPHIHVFVPG